MQVVLGTRYIDEPIRLDVDTDGDGDCLDSGGSTFYYYHQDANYNVIALTDSSGDVVHRYLYDAYGRPHTYTVNGDGVSTAEVLLPGLDADGDGDVDVYHPFLFNGQPYDTETGFYYYRTRYLDPRTGRFTTRDSIGIWGDPLNAGNGYAYVGSNPVTRVDPFGLELPGLTEPITPRQPGWDWWDDPRNQPMPEDVPWRSLPVSAARALWAVAPEVGGGLVGTGTAATGTWSGLGLFFHRVDYVLGRGSDLFSYAPDQLRWSAADRILMALEQAKNCPEGPTSQPTTSPAPIKPEYRRPGTKWNPDGSPKHPADQHSQIRNKQRRNPGDVDSKGKSEQNEDHLLRNYHDSDWDDWDVDDDPWADSHGGSGFGTEPNEPQ